MDHSRLICMPSSGVVSSRGLPLSDTSLVTLKVRESSIVLSLLWLYMAAVCPGELDRRVVFCDDLGTYDGASRRETRPRSGRRAGIQAQTIPTLSSIADQVAAATLS